MLTAKCGVNGDNIEDHNCNLQEERDQLSHLLSVMPWPVLLQFSNKHGIATMLPL